MKERTTKPVVSSKGAPSNGSPVLFPIVGLGTSAGGLEALDLFLRHVPSDCGMAFVVIQHLSPDHTGNLSELLQRFTMMKVQQVNDTIAVLPNCVYVIPPNKDMTISNRTLHLTVPDIKLKLRLPIDIFLRSLAEDCAEQSIGVILSGMGLDGTMGMLAIREQGGLTLAQEPASAQFDSMPLSVINAGYADIVAPAEQLPARIIDFLGYATPRIRSKLLQLDKEQIHFEKIISILKDKTQHDFSLYKPSSVSRRIERRMTIYKLTSVAEYARYLQKNSQEVELLFKELLVGVTSFFRDPAMWDELKKEALPKILTAYPDGGTLRAWSCGCSSGEEAYSLAMLFRETLDQEEKPGNYSLQLFATDLDADAIGLARLGIYPNTIKNDVSSERLQRFFVKEGNRYQVGKEIRGMVTFAQQNAIMDPPFTKLDILICRNLLIYLSTDLQKQLMQLFHYALKPGGLLFLGSAETTGSQGSLFSAETVQSKLFWRSTAMFRSVVRSFPTITTFNRSEPAHQELLMHNTEDNLKYLADSLILQHFSTPTVLVNDQGDIVYISGKTGKYLEPAAGKANLNIFAMAREGLQYKLGSAFKQALLQSEPVTVRGELGDDNNIMAVDMTILNIETPEELHGMAMISFKDVILPPKTKRRRAGKQPGNAKSEELEQELVATREELLSARKEMDAIHAKWRSANEELQSTNEELQSSNEELTTSKEEIQSMNEELQSVNAEQSDRLDDYLLANNDMENLLNSTGIATIFLDNQLQIRRFTTGVDRLFNLIPGDVGRPLADIVSNLNYPQLYNHVQDVLTKLISAENKVSTVDDQWFLVRIMPYRTMDKKINGVVITFNDITAAKQVEDGLREEIAKLKAQVSN